MTGWKPLPAPQKPPCQPKRSPRWALRLGAGPGLLALLGAAGSAACGAILGLGDLSYDLDAGPGGSSGGQGGGQGGLAGGAAGTGGGGQGGSAGGAGGAEPVAPPLELTGAIADGALSARVAGFFRLAFLQTERWQVGAWYDLASDPQAEVDLASTGTHGNVLCEPFESYQSSSWHGVGQALSGVMNEAKDQSPARAILDTTMGWSPAGSGLEVHAVYTVWASGRVGMRSTLTNTGGTDQVLGDLEYNHHTVSHTLTWIGMSLGSQHAWSFVREDGAEPHPGILVINHEPHTPLFHDNTENVYWHYGGLTLTAGAFVPIAGEFQVGVGGLDVGELSNRAADVLAPELVAVGATLVGTGFDPGAAAYVVAATAETISLVPSAAQPRHAPAFVVQNFPYASWSVQLAGEEIAHADRLSSPHGHAYHDVQAGELVFVYLGEIPTSASDPERTFEVTGEP